jgi:hypothetical protein
MTDLLLSGQKISQLMCSSKMTKRITWNLQLILELDIVPCRRSYLLLDVGRFVVIFPTWPECHADHVDCGMLESLLLLGSPLAKMNKKDTFQAACLNCVLKDVLLR